MSEPAVSRGRAALSPIHARAQMHRGAERSPQQMATTTWHRVQKRVYARGPFIGWGFGGWGYGDWPYGPYFDDNVAGAPFPMQDAGMLWPTAPGFYQPPPCVVPLVLELRHRTQPRKLPAVIYGSPASCPPPVLAAAHVTQGQRK